MKRNGHPSEGIEFQELYEKIGMAPVPRADVADAVMRSISGIGDSAPKQRRRGAVHLVKTAAAALVLLFALSGFAYAAAGIGSVLLSLKNSQGQTTIEVHSTDKEMPDDKNEIIEDIQKRLQPGEHAHIDWEDGGDTLSSDVFHPYEYADERAFLQAIDGPLRKATLSVAAPERYTFVLGQIWRSADNDPLGDSVSAVSSGGLPYTYRLSKATGPIDMVGRTYRGAGHDIRLTVSFAAAGAGLQFYDRSPSRDAVEKIAGTETYFYQDGDQQGDFREIMWGERAGEYQYNYALSSESADRKELRRVAADLLRR